MENNYEQKYKKALDNARLMYDAGNNDVKHIVGQLFPELAESEDEKIRKWLLDFVQGLPNEGLAFHCYKPTKEQVIVWLEKQAERKTPQWMIDFLDGYRRKIGCSLDHDEARDVEGKILCIMQWLENQDEQEKDILEDAILDGNENGLIAETIRYKKEKKSEQKLDKVKPKFHEGEWITNGDYIWKIVKIKPLDYTLLSQDDNIVVDTISHVDEQFHSFTIQDAKDGDVLYSLDSCQPFIYKERKPHEQATSYCGINKYNQFFVGNTKDCMIVLDKYVPATKEQRDLFFQKMNEAGYTFDFENKKLKKIEPKTKENNGNIGGISPNWSEEDGMILSLIVNSLKFIRDTLSHDDKIYS